MKKLALIFILICICCCTQAYSQNKNTIKVTKELICKGAAISVVGNVKPFFDLNFSKSKVLELTKDLVKEPINDAPSKAYDLFKNGKTKEQVTEILYNDFMKLNSEVVHKFLINCDPGDL